VVLLVGWMLVLDGAVLCPQARDARKRGESRDAFRGRAAAVLEFLLHTLDAQVAPSLCGGQGFCGSWTGAG
jgi:hypothetical protein